MSRCNCLDCHHASLNPWLDLAVYWERKEALREVKYRERKSPSKLYRVVKLGTYWHVQIFVQHKGKGGRA